MKILITGGAGYIGSVLVADLLATHHEVTVVDNFMWGQTSLSHLCWDPLLTIVRADARDMRVMRSLLQHTDVFIPLAALVGAPLCERNPADAVSINVDAVRGAFMFMSKEQKVLIPISNSGYGVGEKDAYCTEDTPMRPISLYGQTKCDVEKAALDRGSAISLRLATVFGMSPRMRLDLLVNDFTWRAVRDHSLVVYEGHFRRNFVHVRDVASAFVHVLCNWSQMRYSTYNVGDERANMTKWELCATIAQHVRNFKFVAGDGQDPDKRDYIVSNDRIMAADWSPRLTLSWGIKELIRGYQMFRQYEHGNV